MTETQPLHIKNLDFLWTKTSTDNGVDTQNMNPQYGRGWVEDPTMNPDTATTITQEAIFRIHTKLAGNPHYELNSTELALLTHDYHVTMNQSPEGSKLTDKDAADILIYSLARLVDKKHIGLLGQKIAICLTDDHETVMERDEEYRSVPDKRARVYEHTFDDDWQTHKLTFLLRSSLADSNTDAHEIISVISEIEHVKTRIIDAFKQHGDESTQVEIYRKALSDACGKTLTTDQLKNWSEPGNVSLKSDTQKQRLRLPWEVPSTIEGTAAGYTVKKLKEKLTKENITIDGIVLGNEFSIPLMIASTQLDKADIRTLAKVARKEEVEIADITLLRSLKGDDNQDMVENFAFTQYVMQYKGKDEAVLTIKSRINDYIDTFRIRALKAKDTPLGSPIDVLKMENLNEEDIAKIPLADMRLILSELKSQKSHVLQIPYPLGDNTYSLIKALYAKDSGIVTKDIGIGFFGKVGAAIDGDKVIKLGRVAHAEWAVDPYYPANAMANMYVKPPEKVKNSMKLASDFRIISAPDRAEIVVCVDGVLLQTRQDLIAIKKKLALQLGVDPETITVLLDMESVHLERAAIELGIEPAIAYYISDHSELHPTGKAKTLAHGLGAKGTLASLTTALSVLHKIFEGKHLSK